MSQGLNKNIATTIEIWNFYDKVLVMISNAFSSEAIKFFVAIVL